MCKDTNLKYQKAELPNIYLTILFKYDSWNKEILTNIPIYIIWNDAVEFEKICIDLDSMNWSNINMIDYIFHSTNLINISIVNIISAKYFYYKKGGIFESR